VIGAGEQSLDAALAHLVDRMEAFEHIEGRRVRR
jgi:hypothetical protein